MTRLAICLMSLFLPACSWLIKTDIDSEQFDDRLGAVNTMLLSSYPEFCTRFSLHACSDKSIMPVLKYVLDQGVIDNVEQWPLWRPSRFELRDKVVQVLTNLLARNTTTFSEVELRTVLAQVWRAPSQTESFAKPLLQHLSQGELSILKYYLSDGFEGGHELNIPLSTDESMRTLRHFVAGVKKLQRRDDAQPVIAIISAGSVNPHYFSEIYRQIFARLGAKAIALPLDPAFLSAVDKNECEYMSKFYREIYGLHKVSTRYREALQRQSFYCEHMSIIESLLHSANAVFFLGEENSLLLKSLFLKAGQERSYLKILRKRYQLGSLMIGGNIQALWPLIDDTTLGQVLALHDPKIKMNNGKREVDSVEVDCPLTIDCKNLLKPIRKNRKTPKYLSPFYAIDDLNEDIELMDFFRYVDSTRPFFALGLTKGTDILMSAPRFGRVSIQVLNGASYIFDLQQASYTKGRSYLEIEDIRAHRLSSGNIITVMKSSGSSEVKDKSDVSSVVASEKPMPSMQKIETFRDFSRWLDALAMSSDDDVDYDKAGLEMELEKTDQFWRVPTSNQAYQYYGLNLNILINN